jgi:flap endonuclease-1
MIDLYQVISENAPDAIKTGEIKNHFGRKVAIVCQILIPFFAFYSPVFGG